MLHHHTAYRQSPTSIRHRRCKEVIHQLADSHSGPHMACRHGSCCPPWSRQDVLPRFPPTPQFRFPFELKLLIHANKIHLLLTGMDTTASPCAAALSTPPRACHAATMDTFPLSDCSPRCRFLAAAAPSKGLSAASPPLLPPPTAAQRRHSSSSSDGGRRAAGGMPRACTTATEQGWDWGLSKVVAGVAQDMPRNTCGGPGGSRRRHGRGAAAGDGAVEISSGIGGVGHCCPRRAGAGWCPPVRPLNCYQGFTPASYGGFRCVHAPHKSIHIAIHVTYSNSC